MIGSLTRGGAERVVCTLTREWARVHDVRIVLFSTDEIAYEYGGTIIDLHTPTTASRMRNTLVFIARSVRLTWLFWRVRPDHVFSFMESASFPTILATLLSGLSKRTQVSVRNNPSSIRYRYRVLIPWLYRIPSRVVVPSMGIRGALNTSGLRLNQVAVIPNPVDTERIHRYTHSGGVGPYVLAAGRLVRQKGFDQLIHAFALVTDRDLRLVILGDGPERAALQLQARELRIGARVELVGAVENIEWWYQRAVCFVLSSRYEGWPNVLVEAMANGCPVISFDCPFGPEEILGGGKFGMLIDWGDRERLAAAISEMSMNSEMRNVFVGAALSRAREFDVRRVANRWFSPG